jgi:hypothetical protein
MGIAAPFIDSVHIRNGVEGGAVQQARVKTPLVAAILTAALHEKPLATWPGAL